MNIKAPCFWKMKNNTIDNKNDSDSYKQIFSSNKHKPINETIDKSQELEYSTLHYSFNGSVRVTKTTPCSVTPAWRSVSQLRINLSTVR